jgi:hypothetical protein
MRAPHALEPIGKLGINPAKRHRSITKGRLAVARYVRGRRVISYDNRCSQRAHTDCGNRLALAVEFPT